MGGSGLAWDKNRPTVAMVTTTRINITGLLFLKMFAVFSTRLVLNTFFQRTFKPDLTSLELRIGEDVNIKQTGRSDDPDGETTNEAQS